MTSFFTGFPPKYIARNLEGQTPSVAVYILMVGISLSIYFPLFAYLYFSTIGYVFVVVKKKKALYTLFIIAKIWKAVKMSIDAK